MLKPPVNFIDSSFTNQSKSRIKHFNVVQEFFSMLPFLISTVCSLFILAGYAGLDVYKPLIAGIALSSCIVASAAFSWGFMLKYALVLVIAYFVCWLKLIDFFREGLSFVGNSICLSVGISQAFSSDIYNSDEMYFSYNLVFWILTEMLILLGISARTVRPARILFFLITFAFSTIGMYNDLIPDKLCFILLVFSWIFILIASLLGTNKSKTKQHSFQACFLKYTAVFCALAYAISYPIAEVIKRPEKVNQTRQQIFEITENYSANEIFEMIFNQQKRINIFKNNSSAVGVSNPRNSNKKMGGEGELKLTHTPVLNVTIKNADDIQNTVYLHAYSCESYSGGSWTQTPDISRISDILSDMAYPDIYNIGYELAVGYKHIDKQVVQTQITIEETGADRSLSYIPYFSKPKKNQSVSNYADLYRTIGKNTYTVDYCDFVDFQKYFDSIFNGETVSPNILANFDKYQEYADEHYMQVDSETVKQLAGKLCSGHIPTSQKIQQIKDYFTLNYYYSLSPGITPDGEDFADYFLTEQDCGYCEYFATAGTLLCRAVGIPARYAAGYKIDKADLENAKQNKDGSVTVTVLSDSAHAWTEIYSESTGWIPVDFTVSNNSDISQADSLSSAADYSEAESSSKTESSSTAESKISENPQSSNSSINSSESHDNSRKDNIPEHSESSDEISQNDFMDSTYNSEDNETAMLLKILISFAAIITAAVVAMIIRKIVLHEKAQIALNSKDDKQSVDFVYNRYLKLLKETGISAEKQEVSSTDFENMREIYQELSSKGFERFAEDLKKLTHTAIAIEFGEKKLTGKQREELNNILERLEEFVQKDKLSFEIFILKYIKCILR